MELLSIGAAAVEGLGIVSVEGMVVSAAVEAAQSARRQEERDSIMDLQEAEA